MSGWNGIFYNGVWCCGFDFLPSANITAGGVWDQVNDNSAISSSYARFSGKGINVQGFGGAYIGRSFGVNLASCVVGFAFEPSALPSSGVQLIAELYDSVAGNQQLTLGYNSSGQIGLYSAGGLVGGGTLTLLSGSSLSAAGAIVANSYCYIELVVTIGSSGSAQVWVNGAEVINFTGNTQQTANAWANRFYLGSSSGSNSMYFDDVYMLDTTGTAPLNARLGPVRVQTDGPNADSATGGLNAWAYTTPQGTDYGNAANIPANASQYNYDANVGDRMSFKFPSISTAKVWFLNTWYSAEEDAAGTRTVVPIYRNNSIDQVGPTAVSLGSTFTYYNQPSTIDPNTGNLWEQGTVAAAGGCEIGLKVNS